MPTVQDILAEQAEKSWFSGGNAPVTVHEVIKAIGNGDVDRVILNTMFGIAGLAGGDQLSLDNLVVILACNTTPEEFDSIFREAVGE